MTAQKELGRGAIFYLWPAAIYSLAQASNTLRFVQFEEGLITNSEEHSAGGSDSSLLTILATTGIFGLLAFIWLMASAVFVSWKLFINKENNFNSALGFRNNRRPGFLIYPFAICEQFIISAYACGGVDYTGNWSMDI